MTLKAYRLMVSLMAWCLLVFVGPTLSAVETAGVAASTGPAGHIYDAVTTMADNPLAEDSRDDVYDVVQHFRIGSVEARTGAGRSVAAKGGLGGLGRAGSSSSIWVVEGGSSAAQKLFSKLSKGGVDVTPAGHPGKLVRLPDGGFVGFRGVSKSGPPTIDVNIPGIDVRKIKFPE